MQRLRLLMAVAVTVGDLGGRSLAAAPAGEPVTFSGSIAGILHRHCAGCHHDGQPAPFNLVTYQDARKRAKQILAMVDRGLMPPWLAEPGHGEFSNERRLTAEERELLRRWVADGAPEGDPAATPAPPQWSSGWLAGTPDLAVTMPRPYQLGADGPDVYRNFVIRLPPGPDRWVRAVEFSPGNPRIVHHAFIRVDEEGAARKLEGRDGQPGFTNMSSTARMPGGQFLTWNPGSRPIVSPPGLAWRLRGNSDLVLELHLNRTGKPETIQSSVGLYFTTEPPTNQCHTFKLGSYALDFPAGATNVMVHDSLYLPVDVDVLAVYPHAHFLGREVKAHAVRPDGGKESLLWIRRWDFNWQGDYRYRRPVHLPRGTTIHLEFSYDNSTNNPVNPHHPPRRVAYGERSNDEMCELGVQVLARSTNDLGRLEAAGVRHRNRMAEEGYRRRIAADPADAEAMTRLGMLLWSAGRSREAQGFLDRALRARPAFAEAHHNKGILLRFSGDPSGARASFETALRHDPQSPGTHQQLAFALASLGEAEAAERSFEKALELDPGDAIARDGLTELRTLLKARAAGK